MDELNLQPDALGVSDTTFEVEGYDDQVEQIEQAYPEEDFRTPVEKQEDVDATLPQQEAAPTEGEVPVEQAVEEPTGPTPEQMEAQKQAKKEAARAEATKHLTQRVYNEETGEVDIDSILDAEGNHIATLANGREVIQALKLTRDYNPEKEDKVHKLLSGVNLKNKLEAFIMIKDDPELLAIHDTNGDGELTYNDFYDTTNLNGGDGMTPEEDAIATQELLESWANPDSEARAKAIWEQYGAGQNMALFINRRRKGYFDPSWEEDTKSSGSGAWFDIGASALETIGSVGDVMQGKSWHEDSTFDDDILQHKNTQSLEFLVNNP